MPFPYASLYLILYITYLFILSHHIMLECDFFLLFVQYSIYTLYEMKGFLMTFSKVYIIYFNDIHSPICSSSLPFSFFMSFPPFLSLLFASLVSTYERRYMITRHNVFHILLLLSKMIAGTLYSNIISKLNNGGNYWFEHV